MDSGSYQRQYREIDGTILHWKIHAHKPQPDIQGQPVKIGHATPPTRMNKITMKHNLYDGRGPIPINMIKRPELTGDDIIDEIRSVLYLDSKDERDGVLITPSQEYMEQWLPGKVMYTDKGRVKITTRPWITTHSVYNIILTLIMKEKKGWSRMEEISKVKVECAEGAKDPQQTAPGREWCVQVKMRRNDEWTATNVNIHLENELQEIADLIRKTRTEEVEITLSKEMYNKGVFLDQREWFTRAIKRVTEQTPTLCIKVTKENDLQFMKEILENVRYIYQCDVGDTRNYRSVEKNQRTEKNSGVA